MGSSAIVYASRWVIWCQAIIVAGATCVITYQALMQMFATDESEKGTRKRKIKYTLYGAVIGLTGSSIVSLISGYY